jgi:predicted DNA binding CopG/RHH family protein
LAYLKSLRVNRQDLDGIKTKAKRLGVAYQSLISEPLHQFAA